MPNAAPVQSDFSGGEIDDLASGRLDDRRKTSVKTMLNWIATLQGPPIRRPGTVFVAEVKNSAKFVRLMPFVFNNSQAYIFELGHLYGRIYTQEGQLLQTGNISGITKAVVPTVTTSAAHNMIAGMVVTFASVVGMTQINGLTGTIQATPTATSFTVNIDTTGFSNYTSGGTYSGIQEFVTPWQSPAVPAALPPPVPDVDLDTLYFAQKDDVIYVAHPKYPPQKIVRNASGVFSCADVNFTDGPYLPVNTTSTTLQFNGLSGAGVLCTASVFGVFAATDVGRLIRVGFGGTWTYCKITSFQDTSRVRVTVTGTLGGLGPNVQWRLGLWSATTGYPACVTFHEGRTWWGGSDGAPQQLNSSNSASYEDMTPTKADGTTVLATHAVQVDIASSDPNRIVWIQSNQKGLQVGTLAAEFILTPGATSDFISPTSAFARRQSTNGSATVQPVAVDRATLYMQRSGRKLREMLFFFAFDGFNSEDLTILNRAVTTSGVKALAVTREPFPVVWCLRNDGTLAGCTYQRDVQSLRAAWHRHALGGRSTIDGDQAIVRSIAAIPTNTAPPGNGVQDELWLVSQRSINGVNKQYVEYLAPYYDPGYFATASNALCLDSIGSRASGFRVTAATQANPCVVTVDNVPTFAVGAFVTIDGVQGMEELNGRVFKVSAINANNVSLQDADGVDVNSTAYTKFQNGLPGSRFGFLFERISTAAVGSYLEGESIAVLADGYTQAPVVVASGVAALSPDAGFQTWGFPYNSDLELLRMDAGSATGSSEGKTQQIHQVGVRVAQAGEVYGSLNNFDDGQLLQLPNAGAVAAIGAPLFTGMIVVKLPKGGKGIDETICIRAKGALPATILQVAMQLQTSDNT